MRRTRQLRPDTFPFLAVLLCAMGSLLLLLLVMDRRAKVVARAKALQALTASQRREVEEAEARRAEWERRRAALHAELEKEDRQIRQKLRRLGRQLADTQQNRQHEEREGRELGDKVRLDQVRLQQIEKEVGTVQQQLPLAERQGQLVRRQLLDLTGELKKLETTLAALKQAKQREHQTCSLVPYRGKRGENRRPLYVECTAGGVIFQPERVALEGSAFTPAAVRAEAERRVRRQRELLAQIVAKPEQAGYFLFLLRPDGIDSYYKALSALSALDLDYGYELIDPDWALDIPADDATAVTQPWMTTGGSRGSTPIAATSPRPGQRVEGVAFGPDGSRSGAAGSTNLVRPGGGWPPGQAGPGGLDPGRLAGQAGPGGSDPGRLAGAAPGAGPEKLFSTMPRAATARSGSSVIPVPGATGARPHAGTGQAPTARTMPNPGSEPRKGDEATGQTRAPGALQPSGGQPPGSPGAQAADSPGAASTTDPAEPGGRSGEVGLSGAGGRGDRQRGPAQRPIRVFGDRDFVIRLECVQDALVLYPGGRRYPLPGSGRTPDQDVVQAIQTMIERRQATVRPGEVAFRPQVRFLVRPDGLRSFFAAYPALEGLKLPMSRLDLEQDEELP